MTKAAVAAHLLLGGMISPLPSHSPHTAWLCCTMPGPIWEGGEYFLFFVSSLSPNLDGLYLDPPPLAAGAALHIGPTLPSAVGANAIARRRKLPRLSDHHYNRCNHHHDQLFVTISPIRG